MRENMKMLTCLALEMCETAAVLLYTLVHEGASRLTPARIRRADVSRDNILCYE